MLQQWFSFTALPFHPFWLPCLQGNKCSRAHSKKVRCNTQTHTLLLSEKLRTAVFATGRPNSSGDTRFATPVQLSCSKSHDQFIQTWRCSQWQWIKSMRFIWSLLPHFAFHLFCSSIHFQYTGSLNQTADYSCCKYILFLLSQYLSPAQAYRLCQIIHCSHNSAFCTYIPQIMPAGLVTFQHYTYFPSINFPQVRFICNFQSS